MLTAYDYPVARVVDEAEIGGGTFPGPEHGFDIPEEALSKLY